MIDTHAHLDSIPLNLPLTREAFKGLEAVILAASNEQDSVDNLKLAKANNKLLSAVGIHPQELITNYELSITNLDNLLKQNKNIVAVGECGLEFNPSKSPFDKGDFKKQEILFREQIELAIKYKKPLIVHSREAAEETLRILGEYKNLRGVIHCYAGGKKRIKRFLDLPGEWYFGIDGNVTYEVGLEKVVDNIPKDRLVLETDSPFLTPVPYRGEKNKPEYIKYVYEKVAEIWQMSFEETEKIIDENAKRLFQII